jgi:hypothetical protein
MAYAMLLFIPLSLALRHIFDHRLDIAASRHLETAAALTGGAIVMLRRDWHSTRDRYRICCAQWLRPTSLGEFLALSYSYRVINLITASMKLGGYRRAATVTMGGGRGIKLNARSAPIGRGGLSTGGIGIGLGGSSIG